MKSRFIGLVVGALLTGCLVQHDDGFRSRLAQGCASEAQCAALHREASRRHAKCPSNCQGAAEDERTAQGLYEAAKGQGRADQKAQQQQRTADNLRPFQEHKRLDAVGKSLTGKCTDEGIVERALTEIPPETSPEDKTVEIDRLKRAAVFARTQYWNRTAAAFHNKMKRYSVEELQRVANFDTAEANITSVQEELKAMPGKECAGKMADDVTLQVDAWATELRTRIATEKTCRASDDCLAKRYAAPLCDALESKRFAQQDLARERSNPSGIVNLTAMNDLGRRMQDADDDIAEKRKDYASKTKKPFNENMCKK